MSCITDSKTLENTFQPSLIYPSLSHYPKVARAVPDEKTDLQACIHFASRLIKLRSELRSSSYMSSSTSLQLLKTSSIPPTSSSSVSSISFSSTTMTEGELRKPLNKTSRVYSLPNVNQYSGDDDSFMDNREDESEIMDKLLSMNGKRQTSQLIYMTEIIRQSMRRRQDFHSQSDQFYLALPPKDSLCYNQIKKSNSSHSTRLSSSDSVNKKLLQKSTSLRDILLLSASSQAEIKPEPQNQKEEKQPLIAMRCRHPTDYPSFTLASQLASASTTHPQGEDERNRKKKQKEREELKSPNNNNNQENKEPRRYKSFSTINTCASSYHTSNDTINGDDDDDDKDDDEDDETESEVILIHAVPATAFLVSLSPSAAAAASAARFRRRRPILHGKDNKNSNL